MAGGFVALGIAFASGAVSSGAAAPAETGGGTADPAPATPAAGKIATLSDGRLRLGEITFDQKLREIRFPAEVNMTRGLLEYAIVHENGKVHESLLVTKARPFELNIVLLLLGFRESRPLLNPTLAPERRVDEKDEPPAQTARSRLDVHLEWVQDDKTRSASLASWLASLEAGKPKVADEGPWIYTGSLVSEGRFIAEVDGSILAVYLDPNAMINNPREGNFNDDIWIPAEMLPEPGTPVTVVLKPTPPSSES